MDSFEAAWEHTKEGDSEAFVQQAQNNGCNADMEEHRTQSSVLPFNPPLTEGTS